MPRIVLPPLAAALADVRTTGFAGVRNALPERDRARLLEEAAAHPFLPLPARVGGVRHAARQLVVPLGDERFRMTTALALALRSGIIAAAAEEDGLDGYAAVHATFMRYAGAAAGIAPHRDGRTYGLLVCIFTLQGSAEFRTLDAPGAVRHEWLTAPGDLCMLRAPGFGGADDGRPLHAVGPPMAGERISLTYRASAPSRRAVTSAAG